MDRAELGSWLRLLLTPGVGRSTARALLTRFGSPQALFDAPAAAWRDVVSASVAQGLGTPSQDWAAVEQASWAWLAGEDPTPSNSQAPAPPRSVLALGDAEYPAPWLQIADPPLLLFTQGDTRRLSQPSLALVGSRNATPQGLINAKAFAQALSNAGLCVVSGLASGIDGAAHEGALMEQGGTIAFVGTGLDRVYPRRHHNLAHRIAEHGLLVSEYAPSTPPLAAHFPQRNRLIAGLSLGTLVVEAGLPSGSLITARLAMEAGREVFAIPGSIHAPLARGCHSLIKQGAKLVECAQDIFDELRWNIPAADSIQRGTRMYEAAQADPLLSALGNETMSLEALATHTGWPPHTLHARMLDLELAGDVARLPGQLFQRLHRA